MRSANRRLLIRVMTLVIVGLLAAYFQRGYETDGQIWMLFVELTIYFVAAIVFLTGQTGRLKSGPDTSRVSSEVLFEEDPSVRTYIALYLVFLMLVVLAYTMTDNEIDLGPWNIFVSTCPIVLIVFVRQHRLERRRELN